MDSNWMSITRYLLNIVCNCFCLIKLKAKVIRNGDVDDDDDDKDDDDGDVGNEKNGMAMERRQQNKRTHFNIRGSFL